MQLKEKRSKKQNAAALARSARKFGDHDGKKAEALQHLRGKGRRPKTSKET